MLWDNDSQQSHLTCPLWRAFSSPPPIKWTFFWWQGIHSEIDLPFWWMLVKHFNKIPSGLSQFYFEIVLIWCAAWSFLIYIFSYEATFLHLTLFPTSSIIMHHRCISHIRPKNCCLCRIKQSLLYTIICQGLEKSFLVYNE